MLFGGLEFLVIGALVGGAVAIFWDEITSWFKQLYNSLPESIKQGLQDVTAFIVNCLDGIFNIMNFYSFNHSTRKWTETTKTREIDPSQLPDNIREKLRSQSTIEVTQELKEKLELTN